jgi:serine phosphatase RsbU (regulator of sigma subunit)/putative methionine-R-sulfoxide reductase with GAF domain
MTTDTPSSKQRFELLYRTSQAFNSSLNIVEVFDRIIDEVLDAVGAEHGYVISRQSDGELFFHVARGAERQILDHKKLEVSRSIIDEAIDTQEPVLSFDALSDQRFNESDSVFDLKLKSILCVPLKCKGRLKGVIYVENRGQEGIFTERELELLTAIAANAAVAIDNAQYFQEVDDHLQKVNLLYEISADLSSQLDLDQLLTSTLQRVQQALEAPAASLLTVEGENLVFQVALGEKSDEIKPFQVPIEGSIAGWVVQKRTGTIVNDVKNDPRFYQATDDESGFVTHSLIAAPLMTKEDAIGVIELFNKPGGFSENDLELLSAIAANAAIAIENARLYQAAVEKGRMERELQMALSVQTGLLPEQLPEIPSWSFASCWKPAREVSGDFYDFVRLDSAGHTLFNETAPIGLLIADVTDKGMPAALFMAFTRSILRASLHQVGSPAEGITQANHLTCDESSRGLFVTLFYAQLSPSNGDITYVNAGHNPPLVYRTASDTLERLMPTGIPVGIDEDFIYQQERITLAPGDLLISYTDGVTEAVDHADAEFGMARLEQIVLAHKHASADDVAAAIENAVIEFSPPGKQFDDLTIVVARRDE